MSLQNVLDIAGVTVEILEYTYENSSRVEPPIPTNKVVYEDGVFRTTEFFGVQGNSDDIVILFHGLENNGEPPRDVRITGVSGSMTSNGSGVDLVFVYTRTDRPSQQDSGSFIAYGALYSTNANWLGASQITYPRDLEEDATPPFGINVAKNNDFIPDCSISFTVEVDGVGAAPPVTCFWTDLVDVTQVCGSDSPSEGEWVPVTLAQMYNDDGAEVALPYERSILPDGYATIYVDPMSPPAGMKITKFRVTGGYYLDGTATEAAVWLSFYPTDVFLTVGEAAVDIAGTNGRTYAAEEFLVEASGEPTAITGGFTAEFYIESTDDLTVTFDFPLIEMFVVPTE